jgi:hypothetical protein
MFTEFNSIIDLINKFPTEQHCIDHLEAIRWNGNVVSPFDETSKVYKCAGNKYKCKNTGKYFNVRTATIFEDTKMPLQKWFVALYIFSSHKKGISSHQLAKDLAITQKTAWFVLHRLRYAFDHPYFKAEMTGVVEMDESYFGGDEKNRHQSKKGKKEKTPMIGIVERGGNVHAQIVESVNAESTDFMVEKFVGDDAHVMTDSASTFRRVKNTHKHSIVNHSAKEYVNGMAHTNTIEGFWSHFKRGIDGIYHHVSMKHLQRYAHEFTLRYNSREVNECYRFNFVLSNMIGRLKYDELTAKR